MSGDALEWIVYGVVFVGGVTGVVLDVLDGRGAPGEPDYAMAAGLNYTIATFALLLLGAKAIGVFADWIK